MWPQRVRYALRALIALALRPSERISAGEIARRYGIPAKYLEAILLELRQAGLVDSSKGKTGGYRLVKEPSAVRLLTIVQALEPGWFAGETAESPSVPPEEPVLGAISDEIRSILDTLTLEEAVARWQNSSGSLTYII